MAEPPGLKFLPPESGFPTGEGVGRIGFAVYDENTVYAVHDNQFRRPKKSEEKSETNGLKKEDFETMSNADFQKLDNDQLDTFLKENRFPKKYTATAVKELVSKNEVKPVDLALYLGDDDENRSPVIGAEVYRSDDAGKTWKKQNEEYIDDLFYSYGYVFAQVG